MCNCASEPPRKRMGEVEGEEPPPPEPVPPLTDEEYEERKGLYQQIIESLDPNVVKKASVNEREKEEKLEKKSLTYGEVDIDTLHQLLNMVKKEEDGIGPLYKDHGIFLDLGSGIGKPCFAAALLHPFAKVVGIETMQCLNEFATATQAKYQELGIPETIKKTEVQLIKGSFVDDLATSELQPMVPQVTVCLAVATCFGDEEMKAIRSIADQMPELSVFITFTQMLPKQIANHPKPDQLLKPINGGWKLVYKDLKEMSWGPASCFMWKKMPPPLYGPEEWVEPTPEGAVGDGVEGAEGGAPGEADAAATQAEPPTESS